MLLTPLRIGNAAILLIAPSARDRGRHPLGKVMFDFWGKMRQQFREFTREDRRFFTQYVGENTLLMYTKEELFLYLDGRDASLTPCVLREGTWEAGIGAFINRTLPAGGCFLDIGANNGIHSLRAARKVGGNGIVIAIEPQERLNQLIQRSACANLMVYRVHTRRMAIGAVEGTASLGKFAYLTGSATLTPNEMIVEREEVPMAPLDIALAQISAEIGRPCIPDLIKIDVEGYEYDVWDGMKEWARAQARLAMVIEYSPVSYRDVGRNPLRLLEEFVEYGFSVSALNDDGTTSPVEPAGFADLAEARRQFDLVLKR